MADIKDFLKLDIRVGEIVRAETFPKAKEPAYRIWVDLGEEIGIKKSSAKITELYSPEDIMGKQVLCVTNFPSRQIADFMSEILVLGIYSKNGVVLIKPEVPVEAATPAPIA